MKKALLLILLFSLSSHLQAQRHKVSGYVLDANTGEGLPGVNVVVKGTFRGLATNIDGFYSIEVKMGEVLVFSFLGMRTQEVKIDNRVFLNVPLYYNISDLRQNTQLPKKADPKKGIGILTDNSPHYKLKRKTDKTLKVQRIRFRARRKKASKKGDVFLVDNHLMQRMRYRDERAWKAAWKQTTTFRLVNRLPRLQNNYAQGRPINRTSQWQGAETGEVLSWGPAIASLYADNQVPYAYDNNGRLTKANTGFAAKAYDPLSFLRNGLRIDNEISVSKIGEDDSRFYARVSDQRTFGIIPGATTRKNQVHMSLGSGDEPFLFLSYTNQRTNLPERGASWQNIMRNVFTTPPSFDQANGLDRNDALRQSTTYLRANGAARSPAPGLIDNPYGIVSQQPDYSTHTLFRGGIRFQQNIGYRLSMSYRLGFESDNQHYVLGILPGSSAAATGRLVKRLTRNQGATFEAQPRFRFFNILGRAIFVQPQLNQYVYFNEQRVNRVNAQEFVGADIENISNAREVRLLNKTKQRWLYKANPGLLSHFYRNMLNLSLHNQFYVSSTLASRHQQLFLPTALLNLRLQSLFNIEKFYYNMNFFGGYKKRLREAPLVNSQWAYNTTHRSLSSYAQYYESEELLHTSQVAPELKTEWHAGINIGESHREKHLLSISYRHERTQNLLVPIAKGSGFAWANVGTLNSKGWEAMFKAEIFFAETYAWKTKATWRRFRPEITSLANGVTNLPIAGYQDVGRRLIAGQPYGVIYGSRYLRNAAGQLMIGSSGFPLKDVNPGILGNPNPEWTLQWLNTVRLDRFELQWILNYQHGGDRWNGTQAMLDYAGTSQQTADLRNTQNYVFAGTNAAGQPNQIPVSFADPVNGLVGNRWVRYGTGVVAEDYIENASLLQLEMFKLTYSLGMFMNLKQTSAWVSVFAKNILLYTPYSGLDPGTRLMNYREARGLDLFNTPGITSVGFQFQVVF